MSQISEVLNLCQNIVTTVGKTKVTNSKTLSEILTIDNIPYWEVFSSELSTRYFPAAYKSADSFDNLTNSIKPYLVNLKNFILDKNFIKKNESNEFSTNFSTRILCLEFMPQQSRDVMQPVVKALCKAKDVDVLILRDGIYNADYEQASLNLSIKSIWSFWNKDLEILSKQTKKYFKSIRKEINKKNILEKSNCTDDLNFMKRIQRAINRFFFGEFGSLIRRGVISKSVIEKYKPSLLITTDINDPRTRIYMLLCKRLGIPCLNLQHGLTNSMAIEWKFFPADKVVVWGDYFKKILISHGISKNSIYVSGAPRSDILHSLKSNDPFLLKKQLGIPKNAPTVLLASTFTLGSYDQLNNDHKILIDMKKTIFDIVNKLENIYLIVKPHPEENETQTKNLVESNDRIIYLDKKKDIKPYTNMCDCFLSFGSTTTIDAILLNKLVICPAFPGWIWSDTCIDTEVVYAAHSYDKIFDILHKVSIFKHQKLIHSLELNKKKFISNWFYKFDGKSSNRISQIALDMIRKAK